MIARNVALLGAMAIAACSAVPGGKVTTSPASPRELSGTARIAEGIYLLPGRFEAGSQPDGNSVIIAASEGAIVVDSGRHAGHTQRIVDALKGSEIPLRAVINTHWHLDHVGGNASLRRAYPQVRVYASSAIEGAMNGFLARYRSQLQTMIANAADESAKAPFLAELAIIDSGSALYPDEAVTASGPRVIAGRALDIRLESNAVTAGDLWLLDRQTGVLIAGDLVTLPAPFLDTACPSGWSAALDRIAATPFNLLVPGHGAPMSRPQFETWRRAYASLLECAASAQAKEACVDGWVQQASSLIAAGDEPLAAGLIGYYLDNHLRGNAAGLASLCGQSGH